MSGELVPAEQVFEGELVDERAALVRRIEATWRYSRVVPPALIRQARAEAEAVLDSPQPPAHPR